MKLLFYDKFFESLILLPKSVQKKVIDFQKKFRNDSKSSGIHLESISTFKDKSLRSARVDKTYRAIIKAPNSGDIYYLLWVDHHDKAYEWAENKVFQWNNSTQSMQMFTAPEKIFENRNKNEISDYFEPTLSKYNENKLVQIGVPEVLVPSIKRINTIEDLEIIEEFIPPDTFENLFYLLEGTDIDKIIFEVEEGKVEEEIFDAQLKSINNQRSFIELTDDTLFNEILSGNLFKWKYYLHPSQRKLVSSNFNGSVKVSGGAGTGKTVAALHRLKYLAKIKGSNENILFTTFTNVLTENINQLVNGLQINTENITIINIDKFILDLVNKYEILPEGFKIYEFNSIKNSNELWEEVISSELTEFSPDFLETEFKDVLLYNNVHTKDEYLNTSRKGRGKPISRKKRIEIWNYFERFKEKKAKQKQYYKDEVYNILFDHLTNNENPMFDYCIIDELQDFSNIELRVVRALVKDKPNDLFMVGDPMQKIYNRHINFSNLGINVRGNRSRRLRINYRTTEEIKKLAFSIIRNCDYDNFDGEEELKTGYVSLFHGLDPTYKVFKTKNDEIKYILEKVKILKEREYQYNEIGICGRTKDSLKEVRNLLHQSEIPYSFNDVSKNNNSISLLTFHKTKGLEFKHIIIVDANQRSIPKLPFDFDERDRNWQNSYLKNEKSLLYVAISRAIESVTITGTGNKSDIINI